MSAEADPWPTSNNNPFYLIERHLIISSIIESRCPRRLVSRDLLSNFDATTIFQVRRDAGENRAIQ